MGVVWVDLVSRAQTCVPHPVMLSILNLKNTPNLTSQQLPRFNKPDSDLALGKYKLRQELNEEIARLGKKIQKVKFCRQEVAYRNAHICRQGTLASQAIRATERHLRNAFNGLYY